MSETTFPSMHHHRSHSTSSVKRSTDSIESMRSFDSSLGSRLQHTKSNSFPSSSTRFLSSIMQDYLLHPMMSQLSNTRSLLMNQSTPASPFGSYPPPTTVFTSSNATSTSSASSEQNKVDKLTQFLYRSTKCLLGTAGMSFECAHHSAAQATTAAAHSCASSLCADHHCYLAANGTNLFNSSQHVQPQPNNLLSKFLLLFMPSLPLGGISSSTADQSCQNMPTSSSSSSSTSYSLDEKLNSTLSAFLDHQRKAVAAAEFASFPSLLHQAKSNSTNACHLAADAAKDGSCSIPCLIPSLNNLLDNLQIRRSSMCKRSRSMSEVELRSITKTDYEHELARDLSYLHFDCFSNAFSDAAANEIPPKMVNATATSTHNPLGDTCGEQSVAEDEYLPPYYDAMDHLWRDGNQPYESRSASSTNCNLDLWKNLFGSCVDKAIVDEVVRQDLPRQSDDRTEATIPCQEAKKDEADTEECQMALQLARLRRQDRRRKNRKRRNRKSKLSDKWSSESEESCSTSSSCGSQCSSVKEEEEDESSDELRTTTANKTLRRQKSRSKKPNRCAPSVRKQSSICGILLPDEDDDDDDELELVFEHEDRRSKSPKSRCKNLSLVGFSLLNGEDDSIGQRVADEHNVTFYDVRIDNLSRSNDFLRDERVERKNELPISNNSSLCDNLKRCNSSLPDDDDDDDDVIHSIPAAAAVRSILSGGLIPSFAAAAAATNSCRPQATIPLPIRCSTAATFSPSSPFSIGSMSPDFCSLPLSDDDIRRNREMLEEEERHRAAVEDANRRWNETMGHIDLSDDYEEEEEDEHISCLVTAQSTPPHAIERDEEIFKLEMDLPASDETTVPFSTPPLSSLVVQQQPPVKEESHQRRRRRPRAIRFTSDAPLICWIDQTEEEAAAARECRSNYWEMVRLDRIRVEETISAVLKPSHRERIYRDRFAPKTTAALD